MYTHEIATTLIKEATKGKELEESCATRFTSNFLVVLSIVATGHELRMFTASPQWKGWIIVRQSKEKRSFKLFKMMILLTGSLLSGLCM